MAGFGSLLAPEWPMSPSPETEAVALRLLRARQIFLLHAVVWAVVSLYLILLNLLIDGLRTPWSLYPMVAWGGLLAVHWFLGVHLGGRSKAELHERLSEARWRDLEDKNSASKEETRELRQKLLTSAEAAREALRPISPEATADVSKGEALALDLVAWLDESDLLLSRSAAVISCRQRVAHALSQPMPDTERAPLERLLNQLDLHDVKLSVLEREASRRRSVLESFLLVLESAGVSGSSEEVLTAVSDPLRGRVKLLRDVAAAEVAGAAAGEGAGAASDRIREEVRLAQELQKSILPSQAPEVPGLAVAHFYRPSSEVGGDFFDFYSTAPGRLLVAVGDASGHGLDSSMMSSMMKSALYTLVSAGRGLDESMMELNRMMCDTVGRRRLMTLALMELDVTSHRLSWVNAGHVFPLLVRGASVTELEQTNYPLGVRREVDYRVVEEELQPGDRLVLVTDGCVEALDTEGDVYGWERLGSQLQQLAGEDPQAIADGLAEDFWAHLSGTSPQDDITLVVVALQR